MVDREVHIPLNLQPVINAIVRVLAEPYRTFLAQLQADGRITTAEAEAVKTAILERGDRLADLVLEELQRPNVTDDAPQR